jgi:hypothetical protein
VAELFKLAVEYFSDVVDTYEQEIYIRLRSLGKERSIMSYFGIIVDDGDSCKKTEIKYFWQPMAIASKDHTSNMLGYLAALVAPSEFADGNRESAIRLIADPDKIIAAVTPQRSCLGSASRTLPSDASRLAVWAKKDGACPLHSRRFPPSLKLSATILRPKPEFRIKRRAANYRV